MWFSSKTWMAVITVLLFTVYAVLVTILAMPLLGRYLPPEPLRLDKAEPRHGITGTPLSMLVEGTGFDDDTRFWLALDSGNQQAIIGEFETFGAVDQALLNGDTLYLGIREQRIHQLDLSNPDQPEFQKKIPISGMPTALARDQEKLWIATGSGNLIRHDTSGLLLAAQHQGVIADLAMDENGILYGAGNHHGLMIFQMQPNRVELEKVGSLDLPGKVLNILVSGRLAFLGGVQTGLYVCDITNPYTPRLLAALPVPEIIMGMARRENLLLLATSEGLTAIDIADPEHPSVLSRLVMGKFYGVSIEGHRALLAAGAGGLLIVDITQPEQLRVTGHLTPGDSIRCLAVKGDRAYLGTQNSGLLVVDLNRLQGHPDWPPILDNLPTTPVEPTEKRFQRPNAQVKQLLATAQKQLPSGCFLERLIHTETTAYFCTTCGLAVAPLNDPTKLNLLRQPLAYTYGMWISGATGYVMGSPSPPPLDNVHDSLKESSRGLQIFNLSDPLAPRAQGFIKTGTIQDALIDLGRGYLAINGQGVMIVDLRNPEHPQTLGRAELPWPERHFAGYHELYRKDHMLYVACGRAGLQIFDVGNPRAPRRIAATNTPGGWIVRLAGKDDQLFIQNFNNDLQLYDISDAVNPQLTGTLDRVFGVETINIQDDKLRITFQRNQQIERALPLVAEHTDVQGNAQIKLTFPAPVFAGDYRLYAFNRRTRCELPAVITIEKGQK